MIPAKNASLTAVASYSSSVAVPNNNETIKTVRYKDSKIGLTKKIQKQTYCSGLMNIILAIFII